MPSSAVVCEKSETPPMALTPMFGRLLEEPIDDELLPVSTLVPSLPQGLEDEEEPEEVDDEPATYLL